MNNFFKFNKKHTPMKFLSHKVLAGLLLIGFLAACSTTSKPAFYPNSHLQKVGADQANIDYAQCAQLASDSNASKVSGAAVTQAATTGAAAIGVGAAVGDLLLRGKVDWTNIGASIGATAAGAGAAVAVNQSIGGNSVHRQFVEQCLSEKGYKIIGWN